jgi:leucyl aminopeptidase
MKTMILILTLAMTAMAAPSPYVYLTVGSDAVATSQKSLSSIKKIEGNQEVTILKVREEEIVKLSKLMHDKFNRCGGFIAHDSLAEAKSYLNVKANAQKNFAPVNYTITEGPRVERMVSMTSEINIRSTIEKLASFKNRYFKAQTGVDSQAYVKKTWEDLSAGRSDVKVEYFQHSGWPQPSVIMTIEGSSKADEILVIGGHADSIAGWWGRERARAPGADDNASGIATITETIRIAMDNGYKPQRTVKFMAYAAEEVGLRGSKEIAQSYKRDGKKVVGVVQLDMTNHKGTEDKDIVFMTDFTNDAQTKFMGKLIDEYVNVPWGYSKCGYGCSDHASWHAQGYPASMPFESTMGDINGHIHTERDTLSQSNGDAKHAEKFAKLAVAFLVEMGK